MNPENQMKQRFHTFRFAILSLMKIMESKEKKKRFFVIEYNKKHRQKQKMSLYNLIFKVIVIGNTNVGKTSILTKYCDGDFSETDFSPTIGVDFKMKTLEHPLEQRQIRLQIWDTAGQERFRTLVSQYYRGAHCVLMCYDILSPSSFEKLQQDWFNDLSKLIDLKQTKIVVVGCRKDLLNQSPADRKQDDIVPLEQVEIWARLQGFSFAIETSAKTGENIDQLFEQVTDVLVRHRDTKFGYLDGREGERSGGQLEISLNPYRSPNQREMSFLCC